MAVFQCVEDALQCHVLSEAGYGDGWLPSPGPQPVISLDEYREAPTSYALHGPRTGTARHADARAGVDVPTIAQ